MFKNIILGNACWLNYILWFYKNLSVKTAGSVVVYEMILKTAFWYFLDLYIYWAAWDLLNLTKYWCVNGIAVYTSSLHYFDSSNIFGGVGILWLIKTHRCSQHTAFLVQEHLHEYVAPLRQATFGSNQSN